MVIVLFAGNFIFSLIIGLNGTYFYILQNLRFVARYNTTIRSKLECAEICEKDAKCFSVNYGSVGGHHNVCGLMTSESEVYAVSSEMTEPSKVLGKHVNKSL